MSRKYIKSEGHIIEIIKFNILKRGYPIHISKWAAVGWADGLDPPTEGDYLLYTGLMYQMTPFIEELVYKLSKLGSGILLRFGSKLNKLVDVSRIFSNPPKEKIFHAHSIIRSIYRLLVKQGIKVGYNEDIDMYSGALLHEFGFDEELAIHASKVYERLKSNAIRGIVTIDPHTHYLMKTVYPKLLDDYDIDVYNYMELLDPSMFGCGRLNKSYVIHDPCYYARGVGMWIKPRELLSAIGIEPMDLGFSKANTYCCGGPIESLSPLFSAKIGYRRIEQLKATGAEKIIVMCPICLANLSRVYDHKYIVDLSLLLAGFI